MPKLKTHKGTGKRITVTKTGKLLRRRATGSHFLEKKSASRKRHFAGVQQLHGKHNKDIRRNLGV
ncbi:MAG: 50S ribosomal protein L35 [Candidatus Saccharimonadales bacterium]|jgi:large subunit ribosomal protein L35